MWDPKNRRKLAALEAYTTQTQKLAKCFNCGLPGLLKKQSKLLLEQMDAQNQWASGFCTKCKKEKHWAKEGRSKYGKVSNTLSSNNNNIIQ